MLLENLSLRFRSVRHKTGCTSSKEGRDEYCPAGKFQWKMHWNSGTANTQKITKVANTYGITCEVNNVLLYFSKNDTGINQSSTSKTSKMQHFMIRHCSVCILALSKALVKKFYTTAIFSPVLSSFAFLLTLPNPIRRSLKQNHKSTLFV